MIEQNQIESEDNITNGDESLESYDHLVMPEHEIDLHNNQEDGDENENQVENLIQNENLLENNQKQLKI